MPAPIYTRVEKFHISPDSELMWTPRREEVARALVQNLKAVSAESAVAIRDVLDIVGGNYANLRKTLETMPGAARVLPVPYKTKMTQTWYLCHEVVELANKYWPGQYYPLEFSPKVVETLNNCESIMVRVAPTSNPEQTRQAYYKSHGKSAELQLEQIRRSERATTKGPDIPAWVAEKIKNPAYEMRVVALPKVDAKKFIDSLAPQMKSDPKNSAFYTQFINEADPQVQLIASALINGAAATSFDLFEKLAAILMQTQNGENN